MENKFETIKITSAEGKEMELKLITTLKKTDGSKNFILYTFDENTENVDIYASEIKEQDGTYILDSITEKEDWDLIQNAIRELSE